ncbi:hypothetical protein SDC9_146193 [bioreactor metagenome]|uniref:Uncharacterized protein n=1 Tax=bioreactor metagenome TaxID=1076179 RepID=A0A645EE08_9ZZZZ
MCIAHVAFDLRLWHERRDRVHNDDVDCTTAHKCLGNLKRLLARIRLRDVEIVHAYAQCLRICGVERVLRVDERRSTAHALRFGNDMQGDGGFTGGFRPKYLDDSAAWNAANAERIVQREAAGRHSRNRRTRCSVAEFHNCAFAKLLFDLTQSNFQCFFFFDHHSIPFVRCNPSC